MAAPNRVGRAVQLVLLAPWPCRPILRLMPTWPLGSSRGGRCAGPIRHESANSSARLLGQGATGYSCCKYILRLRLTGSPARFAGGCQRRAGLPRYPGQLASRYCDQQATVRRTERAMRRLAWASFSSLPTPAEWGWWGGGSVSSLKALSYTTSPAGLLSFPGSVASCLVVLPVFSPNTSSASAGPELLPPQPGLPAQPRRGHEPLPR